MYLQKYSAAYCAWPVTAQFMYPHYIEVGLQTVCKWEAAIWSIKVKQDSALNVMCGIEFNQKYLAWFHMNQISWIQVQCFYWSLDRGLKLVCKWWRGNVPLEWEKRYKHSRISKVDYSNDRESKEGNTTRDRLGKFMKSSENTELQTSCSNKIQSHFENSNKKLISFW